MPTHPSRYRDAAAYALAAGPFALLAFLAAELIATHLLGSVVSATIVVVGAAAVTAAVAFVSVTTGPVMHTVSQRRPPNGS